MRKIKKGATLLEVVIGLAIIAIMIIPLMNSLLTSVKANKKAEEVQDAKLLGQQFIEKLRLQDEIKGGIIQVGDVEINLKENKEYYEVQSNKIDGIELKGRIDKSSLVKIKGENDKIRKEYFDKKLGALIEISKDEDGNGLVRYYNRTTHDKSILEIYQDDKDNFSKVEDSVKEIKVEFIDTEINKDKRTYGILMNGKSIGTNTIGGLGIYIKDENDFNFKIKNSSAISQGVYVFRDLYVSEGEARIIKEGDGILNIYKNIVFDSEDGNRGLYTANLDIEKDGKKIEEIESQFYLGE